MTQVLIPSYMRLENKASSVLHGILKKKFINYQLVPPGIYRCNAVERSIGAFKDYLKEFLYSTNTYCPMHNWYHLLEHVEITLNILRPSKINPRIPVYAQLNNTFDLNHAPMDPPVTRNLVQNNPHNHVTWDQHGHKLWYICPEMIHYFCFASYTPKTFVDRVSDTT